MTKMASSLPYSRATSGDAALADLQKTLAKFGCQSFGTMVDVERGCTIVAFKWRNRQISLEASWKGYAQALKRSGAKNDAKALAQARIAVCSVLRDWVKGQVTAIECGVMSFEAAFMPHILLPNGQRVIDRVQSENILPPPDEKVVALK